VEWTCGVAMPPRTPARGLGWCVSPSHTARWLATCDDLGALAVSLVPLLPQCRCHRLHRLITGPGIIKFCGLFVRPAKVERLSTEFTTREDDDGGVRISGSITVQ